MKVFFLTILVTSVTTFSRAEDLKPDITWGGFVDTQYAFDFNVPASGDRAFSSQPARTNEFNLNLGFLEANLASEKLRGRLALQAGTSVQSNYAAEPTNGAVSGPDLSRHIQEARIGYKVSDKTWIDAGIFFAHVGAETWISRDNIVLTRSLVADYSPYYMSGVKLTHAATEALTLQLLVTNGWQNISENNTDKNIGTGIEYSLKNISFAYNTLLGNEKSPDLLGTPRPSKFRHYHNFIVRNKNAESLEWVAEFDVGLQKKSAGSGSSDWTGASLMARYKISDTQKIAFRAEHFNDPDQIVIVTGQAKGLSAYGGSIGWDQTLESYLLWRTEVRYLSADEKVFPKRVSQVSESNTTVTTSLALSF